MNIGKEKELRNDIKCALNQTNFTKENNNELDKLGDLSVGFGKQDNTIKYANLGTISSGHGCTKRIDLTQFNQNKFNENKFINNDSNDIFNKNMNNNLFSCNTNKEIITEGSNNTLVTNQYSNNTLDENRSAINVVNDKIINNKTLQKNGTDKNANEKI